MYTAYSLRRILYLRGQLITVLFLCLFPGKGSGEIFSSAQLVIKLAHYERQLIRALNVYVQGENLSGRKVNRTTQTFLNKVTILHERISDEAAFGENPVNCFHLLKRITTDWQDVFSTIWCDTCHAYDTVKEFNMSLIDAGSQLAMAETPGKITSQLDIDGASRALLRLWETYTLPLDKLMNGVIDKTSTDPLSCDDIMTIAQFALNNTMYYEAIIWLEQLLSMNKSVANSNQIIKTKELLARSYYEFGMPWKSENILQSLEQEGLWHINHTLEQHTQNNTGNSSRKQVEKKVDATIALYQKLCREDMKTPAELSQLKCFFRPTSIPYYRSKEEVFNYIPRLSLFHGVLTEEEIQYLKTSALAKLQRSKVSQANPTASNSRVSQTGWLKDTEHPILAKVSKRIGLITGLNTTYRESMSNTEQYQVVNYGVGGMYHPHHDNLGFPVGGPPRPNSTETADIIDTGDRIATWMFYLNTVKAGGATVFPQLKARIPAVKGAAAFWYNYLPNGTQDFRTLHAGCPVLLGSKWITNKWIRQRGQILIRLCELSKEAEFSNPCPG